MRVLGVRVLVAAVPVAVATVAVVAGTIPWTDPARKNAAVGGFATWIAWVVALRFAVPLFPEDPDELDALAAACLTRTSAAA